MCNTAIRAASFSCASFASFLPHHSFAYSYLFVHCFALSSAIYVFIARQCYPYRKHSRASTPHPYSRIYCRHAVSYVTQLNVYASYVYSYSYLNVISVVADTTGYNYQRIIRKRNLKNIYIPLWRKPVS